MTDTRTRTRKFIEVDPEMAERFDEMYPQNGAWTWFVNECLAHFVDFHEVKPSDYIREAVEITLTSGS